MKNTEFRNVEEAKEYLQEKYKTESGFYISKYNEVELSVEVTEVGDKVIVSMLKYDQDPMDYFSNDEGIGMLFQFKDVYERDNKVEELKEEGRLFYLVDKYEHGNVHFSVSKTASYPDRQWDVTEGCAIFVPCDYIQEEYKKLSKKEGVEKSKQNFIKDSNKILDEYSNWSNGEVYGYSVTVFNKKGEELNCDECWGFIGNKYAEEEKQAVKKHYLEKEEKTKNKKPKM